VDSGQIAVHRDPELGGEPALRLVAGEDDLLGVQPEPFADHERWGDHEADPVFRPVGQVDVLE
jgi:hypothetical protein